MSWFRPDRRSKPRPHPPLRLRRKLRDAVLVSSVAAGRPNGMLVTIAVIDPWMRFFNRPGYAIGVRVETEQMYVYATRSNVMCIEDAYRVMILMRNVLAESDIVQDFDGLLVDCRVAVELGDIKAPLPTKVNDMMRRFSDLLGADQFRRIRLMPIDSMPSWVRERIKAERPL